MRVRGLLPLKRSSLLVLARTATEAAPTQDRPCEWQSCEWRLIGAITGKIRTRGYFDHRIHRNRPPDELPREVL